MTEQQKKAADYYAVETSVDYKPWEDNLPPNEYFRAGIEKGMTEVIENPLPYGLAPIDKVRTALADYIASEGCDCCQVEPQHEEAMFRLATLLGIKPYSDGSGWSTEEHESKC